MMHKMLVLVTFALLICCSSQREETESESPTKLSAESYELVDFGDFNDETARVVEVGETWPQDPIRVAQEFMNSYGTPFVSILREDDRGERSDSTTIIIVEDGYQDDSVRGMWNWFRLARSADDTWRIVEVRRAYRCWRGHHRNSFSKESCP